VHEGPAVISGAYMLGRASRARRLDEARRNATAPSIHNGRANHDAANAAPGGLKHPLLHSLAPRNEGRRFGWGAFVHHFSSRISMGPDPAGIDQRLVAAGQGIQNGVDRRAIDPGVIGGSQADDTIGPARRRSDALWIGKVTAEGLNAGGAELGSRSVAPGQARYLVARRPQSLGYGGADVSRGAGKKYLHACISSRERLYLRRIYAKVAAAARHFRGRIVVGKDLMEI
jgi:hypothetical protein